MREMLDQEQILSPSLLKSATWIMTLLLAAFAGLMLLQALFMLLTRFDVFGALNTAAVGVGGPLAVWLVVRQLGEILLAQHRLNDRLNVLGEALRDDREPATGPATGEAAPAPAAAKAAAEPAGFETPAADKPAKPKRRTKAADSEADDTQPKDD